MVFTVAHQPIFAAKQKEGLSRGSKQTFFLLLCRKDGFTSRHRYLSCCVVDYNSRNTMANDIPAYNTAQPLQFTNLDQLLWGIVKTLQWYSLPIMAIAIATLGVFLIMSGDDTDRKSRLKGWIVNILIGGLLIFGAATLASIIKQFVGGSV